jgi:hypothetical protein
MSLRATREEAEPERQREDRGRSPTRLSRRQGHEAWLEQRRVRATATRRHEAVLREQWW